MGRKNLRALLLVLTAVACAPVQPPTQQELQNADPGPYPNNYESIVRDFAASLLFDPSSAQFSNWRGPSPGWVAAPLRGRAIGYRVCVDINSKNRFGGYVGSSPFIFVIANGGVTWHEGGTQPGTVGAEMVRKMCADVGDMPIFGSSAYVLDMKANLVEILVSENGQDPQRFPASGNQVRDERIAFSGTASFPRFAIEAQNLAETALRIDWQSASFVSERDGTSDTVGRISDRTVLTQDSPTSIPGRARVELTLVPAKHFVNANSGGRSRWLVMPTFPKELGGLKAELPAELSLEQLTSAVRSRVLSNRYRITLPVTKGSSVYEYTLVFEVTNADVVLRTQDELIQSTAP